MRLNTRSLSKLVASLVLISAGAVSVSSKGLAAAATLEEITLVPAGLTGGTPVKLRIFLTAAAPAGGAPVVVSGFPGQARATYIVPAGSDSLTPPLIPTLVVRQPLSSVITASYGGVDRSALLTLRPLVPDVVAFGGSGTSGQGLPSPLVESWPARVQAHASADKHNVQIINDGRSGRTTTEGLAEIAAAFTPATTVIAIALGANDLVSGIPLTTTRANLAAMIERARARQVQVLLVGQASISIGLDSVFRELARTYSTALVPDLDAGFTTADRQADGHPTVAGAIKQAANVYPALEPLLVQR